MRLSPSNSKTNDLNTGQFLTLPLGFMAFLSLFMSASHNGKWGLFPSSSGLKLYSTGKKGPVPPSKAFAGLPCFSQSFL